jgi:hypothetical protein
MMILAVGIEHALGVAVQRPHDPDPRKHYWSAVVCDQAIGLPWRLAIPARHVRLFGN